MMMMMMMSCSLLFASLSSSWNDQPCVYCLAKWLVSSPSSSGVFVQPYFFIVLVTQLSSLVAVSNEDTTGDLSPFCSLTRQGPNEPSPDKYSVWNIIRTCLLVRTIHTNQTTPHHAMYDNHQWWQKLWKDIITATDSGQHIDWQVWKLLHWFSVRLPPIYLWAVESELQRDADEHTSVHCRGMDVMLDSSRNSILDVGSMNGQCPCTILLELTGSAVVCVIRGIKWSQAATDCCYSFVVSNKEALVVIVHHEGSRAILYWF